MQRSDSDIMLDMLECVALSWTLPNGDMWGMDAEHLANELERRGYTVDGYYNVEVK